MTTEYTFSDDQISDLHKDAYGYRPSQLFFQRWTAMSDAEKQAQWDIMIEDMVQADAEIEIRQMESVNEFEAKVTALIESGARTREIAVKWLIDSADLGAYSTDMEYVAFTFGLPFNYFKKVA